MKDKVSGILKYILSAALAVLLLWFSFRDVEWKNFVFQLKECRWEFIVLSMLIGVLAFWVRGLRWRQLLLPIDRYVSRLTTFNGINIGNISNFVFPRIGEFVRCGVVTRRNTISYDKVLGTVILERGWELLVMLLLLCVVVIGGFERFGSFFAEKIWVPLSARFDSGLWIIALFLVLAGGVILFLIWKFRDRNNICAKVYGVFNGLMQGFSSCLKMPRKWLFFTYTLLIWLMYWAMAASTIWAAPFLDGLDLIDALFLSLVGGLGFAVPVPGGIGAFHFIISLALASLYGIPMETGIIYATISHTSQAVVQILAGTASYVSEAFIRRK